MINIPDTTVEAEIIKIIIEIKDQFRLDQDINVDCIPGIMEGITSHILVTATGRIANALGIVIPNSCYIFHDKKDDRQLTIKEASQKLIKLAKNAK
jgi:hypothetical protein